MSTHCKIMVKGSAVCIYKHSDGGLDNMRPIIDRALVIAKRRDDLDAYVLGSVLHQIIRAEVEWENGLEKETGKTIRLHEASPGIGIYPADDCPDAYYIYIINDQDFTYEVKEGE